MDDMTIGIFDSGVGGLSVLRHLEHLIPGHPIIYLAERGHRTASGASTRCATAPKR
ncbi:MAG: hypothetical protein GXP34_07465 [Actinobacteria bacterium]|nr:hypothetical protein [Actinomycetota bacterium]